jgi:hypothetical protein
MVVGLFLSFANFYMKMEKRKSKMEEPTPGRAAQFPIFIVTFPFSLSPNPPHPPLSRLHASA